MDSFGTKRNTIVKNENTGKEKKKKKKEKKK